jgi:hypothetical protein
MKQNDSISEASQVRRFVAEQLAAGRAIVCESEAQQFIDEQFPDLPIEARRLIVRNEFHRLERAAVILRREGRAA